MRLSKRKIPEINSSAAADISFLLLIFFILTSSMNPDFIMPNRLSPPPPEDVRTEHIQIKKRNFLPVYIDAENRILCREEVIEKQELRGLAKLFISNPDNRDDLPEKAKENIDLLGESAIAKDHIISLTVDDKADFETYVFVLNELIASYRELRDELSEQKFGRPYKELSPLQKKAVRQYYPQKISKPEKSGKEEHHE